MPRCGNLGGERVVGDFGAGPRHAAEERALAGVRFADEADVGDDFQLEREAARFAFFAAGEFARRLVGRRLEAHVAFAAFAAAGRDHLFAGRRQILQHDGRGSASMTIVPGGTLMIKSSAPRPWHWMPRPCSPRSARHCLR